MARFVNNNTNELLTPEIKNTQTSPFAQSLVSDIVPPSRLGGGVVRGDLQSENYVSAATGWKLRRDGVIEALSIQIAGNSTIAGWNIDSTTIYQTGAVLSSTGYVAFGATPPTAYGNNLGAWLGFTGGKAKFSLYNNSTNYFQWDGDKLLIKAANFTLDSSGNITATAGAIGGWTISTNKLASGNLEIDSNIPRILMKKSGQNKLVIEG